MKKKICVHKKNNKYSNYILIVILICYSFYFCYSFSFFNLFYIYNKDYIIIKQNDEFIPPIKGDITSFFSYRIHPIYKKKKMHTGIDISRKWHDKVRSVENGKVIDKGANSGYGNYILIKHNSRLYTFYAHLSKIYIKKGDKVYKGEVIGLEGGDPKKDKNHGISTGHHLHFEVRKTKNVESAVNPLKYINAKDIENK